MSPHAQGAWTISVRSTATPFSTSVRQHGRVRARFCRATPRISTFCDKACGSTRTFRSRRLAVFRPWQSRELMANADITFTPDPDADSISSDVADFNGLLVSTQIPTRADGSLELGGITEQSECTLRALKDALERAGSSMDRVLHLTIYLTDMADRAAFNEVYKRFFKKPWPVRAAVGVASLAVEGMRVEVTAMAAKAG
ncbi:Endoribonuclease L-PSP protein [Pseudomonas syringae pv. delphinii]|nr:Endoribonuclease L-PSP protein [Pseudomonas syringae pv. delphinii]